MGTGVAAINWISLALTGSAATVVAVIAVAVVGTRYLFGRGASKRVIQVVLGCFVLFGAASISAGLFALAGTGPTKAIPRHASLPNLAESSVALTNADPYAGAAARPNDRDFERELD